MFTIVQSRTDFLSKITVFHDSDSRISSKPTVEIKIHFNSENQNMSTERYSIIRLAPSGLCSEL